MSSVDSVWILALNLRLTCTVRPLLDTYGRTFLIYPLILFARYYLLAIHVRLCFPATGALPDLLHPVCVSACVALGKIIYYLSFDKKNDFLFEIQTQNAPSMGSSMTVTTCPVYPL